MRAILITLIALTSVASAQTEYDITSSDWQAHTYLAHRDTVAIADISSFFQQHLPAAYQAVIAGGKTPVGPATGLYWTYDEEAGTTDMAAAVAFEGDPPSNIPEEYEIIEAPEALALSVDYYGPYDNLIEPHQAIGAYLEEENLGAPLLVVEEYVTDPTTEPDSSKWLTRIHYLVEK